MNKSEHVFHHVFTMRKEANLSCLINPRDTAVSQEAATVEKKKNWAPFFLPFCICWPNMARMHTTGPNRPVNKEDMFLSRAAETLRHCDLGQWAKQSHCHRRLPLPRLHTGYEQFPPSPTQSLQKKYSQKLSHRIRS